MGGSEGVGLCTLNFGTRWKLAVRFTPW